MSEAQTDPKDKRFADPAWQSNPLLKRLLQAHTATGKELGRYIDATSLNARDKARAHLVASIYRRHHRAQQHLAQPDGAQACDRHRRYQPAQRREEPGP